MLDYPHKMAFDHAGHLYIADYYNSRVRLVRVREKSGKAGRRHKKTEGLTGQGAEMLTEGRDLRGAGAAEEGEDHVAEGSHDLGSSAAPQARGVLSKGVIATPMATLDAPMPPDER